MHIKSLPFALVLGLIFEIAVAHEGHQPLPSKGVVIDSERGYITLSGQARNAIGISTEEVAVGDVASTLTAYAETVSPWQAKAYGSAQISGQITKLLVRPGDIVTKDQVVAELSSRELERLRLDYVQSKQDISLNNELLALTRPSADTGAVPMQRVLELENALLQSQNSLQIARIRAKSLGVEANQLDEDESKDLLHELRSPIAGKVAHSDLSEGKFVAAFEHLFEIVNNDEVWVRLQLLEKDIYKVAIGQQVELGLPEVSVEVSGQIDRIDAALDPNSKASWAWLTVSHPKVIPGMVGDARIWTSRQTERIAVPMQSVFSDGLQSYVLVEEASTKASAEYRKRNVIVGKRRLVGESSQAAFIELLQGDVYPGDRVVVQGGHELSSLFFLGVLNVSESDRNRLGIQTATAAYRTIANTLDLAAVVTLLPGGRSVASSQLAGAIRSHQLSPGQQIRKGDLLLELNSPEFHAIQLDLLSAVLDANLTRSRVQRLEQIRSDAFSRRVLLETAGKAEQLERRAVSLKKQLQSLGITQAEVDSIVQKREIIGYLPVRATMDGHLVTWAGTLGETISANQSLAEIQDLKSIWIEGLVPTKDSQLIHAASSGQAWILSNPEIRFPVSIDRIGPIASGSTRTQSIWLSPTAIPDNIQLRDRMQLSVTLEIGIGERASAIPTTAVLQDGIHKFIFIQKDQGYVERRRVTTGRSDGQWVEIVSGIEVGEEAIVEGGRELQTAYASLR